MLGFDLIQGLPVKEFVEFDANVPVLPVHNLRNKFRRCLLTQVGGMSLCCFGTITCRLVGATFVDDVLFGFIRQRMPRGVANPPVRVLGKKNQAVDESHGVQKRG